MTRTQLDRIVHAVTTALVIGRHCTPQVANERARNIAQAVIGVDAREWLAVICATLETRESEIAVPCVAVAASLRAARCAALHSNAERFVYLVGSRMPADEASKYLAGHGWTVPEGMVQA